MAFTIGGGIAGGTISLVSQRYGAGAHEELAVAVKVSVAMALLVSTPVAAAYLLVPGVLVDVIGSGDQAVAYGTDYLRIVALGVPFAALNLVGSRTLVGADDAWTPMVLRGGGAVLNVGVNAVLIFGLGMGVVGAAVGTVIANVAVTAAFAVGLARGGLPLVGAFPVQVPLAGPHFDRAIARDLREIATPLIGTNLARNGAEFPMLAIVGTFGPTVVAAYVVAMRVRALADTPNWGFSLASSSLVGQTLGRGAEALAGAWARDVLRHCVAVYVLIAAFVMAFAGPIGRLFVDDPAILPLVTVFIAVAAISVVFNGVYGGATGPLRASGDTRWPMYAQLAGRYLVAIPLAALGALTADLSLLYLAIVLEMVVPAAIAYHRYRTDTWKVVSRAYRPDVASGE